MTCRVHPELVGRAGQRPVAQRGNPVLFDRSTFPDLMSLRGDAGGRLIFSRYPAAYVPWPDPSLLLDLDTLEDYLQLLSSV